jgi:hypothetical protein
VVVAVIISFFALRNRRRRGELRQVSDVQDRLELSPPPPQPLQNSEFHGDEKSDCSVQPISPDVEPAGLQEIEEIEEHEFEVGGANGHYSIASLGRTTLIAESGSETPEDHTRHGARLHALERAFVSLTARLGMNSTSPEAPPPSYASESG